MAAVSKIKAFCRSALALVLAASFVTASAQTPDDSRDAKIAAAVKIFQEASELVNRGDAESMAAALKKLESLEPVFEALGYKEGLAGTISLEGTILFKIGSVDLALPLLNRSLDVYRSLNNLPGQALVLLMIGGIYAKKGDHARARDLLEEARTLIEKEPFQSVDIQILTALGNEYIALRDFKKTFDSFWKAYEIAKTRTPEEAILALRNYAESYLKLDVPKFAPDWYEIALKRARNAMLKAQEAQVLNDLADVYLYRLDQTDKARSYLLEAMSVLADLDLPRLTALVLNSLGQCSMRSIDPQAALEYYKRALDLVSNKQVDKGSQASILFNIAQVNLMVGENRLAAENLEKVRLLAHETNSISLEASAMIAIADLDIQEGNPKKGFVLYQSAILLVKDDPNIRKVAVGWMGKIAMYMVRGGLYKEGKDLLSRAYTIAKGWEYKKEQAELLECFGIVNYVQGDQAKAIDYYNQSILIFRSLGIKVREARVMENMMLAWSKRGNPALAVFFGKSAVNVFQGIKKNATTLSPEQQKSLMENFASAYRSLSKVLIEQGRIAEAEQVLTMLKEEELIDYVRRDDEVAKNLLATMSISDDERAAIQRYDVLAGQITLIGKDFSELEAERIQFPNGEFPKQELYLKLKQQLADASTTFEKFLEELKIKFGQNDTRVAQVDSGLKKTLDRLKAKHTVAVSTIVGSDTLNIIVTTSKTQRAHTIKVTEKEINDLVAKFRDALTSPKYDPRPIGQQLYDLIVKPIEGDLAGIKADTILWSMDGTLRYIPPAALWDKKNGYMVERFANVMINLASRDSLSLPATNGQKLSVLGVGVSKPTEGFSALTAVPDELDCIVADRSIGLLSVKPQCSSGVLTGRKLLDEKFTLTSFEGELGRYPIVHIASHFKLTPGDDKNSFLLLGGGDDRRFTVEKLRSEPLSDIELIVLSACNTATPGGARANGVEVEGFGSIAQKEGARSVLATLWSVADTSTKDFMVEFYRLYGKEGASKANAMRRAQLKLMYGKYSADEAQKNRADDFVQTVDKTLPPFKPDPNAPFAHPFYWSPFTLSGNWQ